MSRKSSYPSFSWKDKEKEGTKKDNSPKKGSDKHEGQKEDSVIPPPSSSRSIMFGQMTHSIPMSKQEDQGKSSSDHMPQERDLLMVRRLISNVIGDEAGSQRENIFHKFLVLEKFCSIIIDAGSMRELVVDMQVLVAFTIGSYGDEVMCDVVSMKATYILLGKP
ncbi:hypothetical protein CR513_20987, partial [Mucuna pruriens]